MRDEIDITPRGQHGIALQSTSVTVSLVTVKIAYSDSFSSPRFICFYEPICYNDIFVATFCLKTWYFTTILSYFS